MRAQQRAFDLFRRRYNEERPHQALDGMVPDELHVPSTRNRGPLALGGVLAGELVGAKPIDHDRVEFYFGPVLLGYYDPGRVAHRLVRPRPTRRRSSR